ncbi:hypothetical protein BJ684DRAFT_9643 [Piptocephalis cylindrospora]|uniref:N-acetyltransferase domain-containing protein n=1 Tax=Piptocephalis cylindrospora TaxID=1907219 RepID=A0A4P9Y4F0_9FUNG|nr:hypothetical protein BJ684DRAFT_9643 [Piptocephalis cylindrospora]|eukprot:RKP13733.1 hypothetical protein BJ684DRAFT_9643 [Piptocephalis cylindrospora]
MVKSSPFYELLEVKGATIVVRSAASQDLVHLEVLYTLINMANQSSASWTGEGHLVKVERIDRESLRKIIISESFTLLLGFPPNLSGEEVKPIACLEVAIKGKRGYTNLLAVDPAYQSKGVASAMSRASDRYFISHNIFFTVLTVLHRRDDIKAWYYRAGYRPTGRTEPFPDPDNTLEEECYLEEWGKPLKAATCHPNRNANRSHVIRSHL